MIKTPLSTVIGGVGMYTKNSLIIGGGKTEPPFDIASLFENGEIGTLLDGRLNVDEKWRVNLVHSTTNPDLWRNAFISQLDFELQEPMQAAISALYERVIVDGDPQQNWQAALQELGLTQIEPE